MVADRTVEETVAELEVAMQSVLGRLGTGESRYTEMTGKLDLFGDQLMGNDTAIKAVTTRAMQDIEAAVGGLRTATEGRFKQLEDQDLPNISEQLLNNDAALRAQLG